ncbi:kinesin-like protein KIF26B isoform X2 [Pecten maximus]|nr:kinesin-like protein KIF26B isoform X2 [Pecten maximus]
MEKKGKPRSCIPVPVSHSPVKVTPPPIICSDGTVTTSQNDTDGYTETVSVKTAVHMFGGEAKIRKLPTPSPDKSQKSATVKELRAIKEGSDWVKRGGPSLHNGEDISMDFTTPQERDIMDYPIRGTFSPLTDGGQVKFTDENATELSFVFGRPASPVNDRSMQRCLSPPSGRNQQRCLSPESEHNPQRCKSPPSDRGLQRCMSPPSGKNPQRCLSPESDHDPLRCKSPPRDRGPHRGLSPLSDRGPSRCWSPPSPDRRALSPSSDVTPAKRPSGVYENSFVCSTPGKGAGSKYAPGIYDRVVVHLPPTGRGERPRGGGYCQHCNNCLIHFKRQAFRLLCPEGNRAGPNIKTAKDFERIAEKLQVPENSQRFLKSAQCDVCSTTVSSLKREAIAMVQTLQHAQSDGTVATNNPALVGAVNFHPQQRSGPAPGNPHARYMRQGKHIGYMPSSPAGVSPQPQAYYDQPPSNRTSPKKYNQMIAARPAGGDSRMYTSELYMMEGGLPNGHPVVPVHGGGGQHDLQLQQQQYVQHQLQMQQQAQLHQQMQPQQHMEVVPHPGGMHPGVNMAMPSHSHTQGHYAMQMSPTQGKHYVTPPYMNYTVPPPQQQPPPPPTSPSTPSLSRMSSPPPATSAAASFFARAAQKLSKKKKRLHQPPEPEPPPFPTKFYEIIRMTPPPAPPCLLRMAGRLQTPGVGKVKVMLKICPSNHYGEQGNSFLAIDPRKKQVTVYDPTAAGFTTAAHRRTATTTAPKMFAFDAVFSPDDSQTEVCASSLTEIIQGVVNGADGCLFTYGYSKLGKSYTMVGQDQSAQTLGIIPCAIAWLFRLINEQKEKTGARFSVRVSAVEVTGKAECLKDLLSDVAAGVESGSGTAPGVYLREDPICGTQLENQSELRAPTAERATYYLDAAIAARTKLDEEESRSSHLLFTLHVYQYRIEKANQAGLPGVAGGRSRLHLIDLGSSSKSKDPGNVSLSLSALGNVIMALLNGQRHVPHRDSKVAQLLRDSLGNISCRTCMIAHVSSAVPHYNETLQVIQLAAKIHRMRRRKTKFSSTSSDDSSTDDGRLRRPFRGFRMGTLREDILYTSSHSDPDYTSSSEQSCDTVIYVGANGQSLSDRELTDHEGPPRSVPRTNPRLPRRPGGSRSSGDEGSNSDSGRSHHSDFRIRKPNMGMSIEGANLARMPSRMSTPVRELSASANEHAQSPPMSPSIGGVQLPRKANVRTKLVQKAEDGSGSANKVDKIALSTRTAAMNTKMASGSEQSFRSEQWVDGPGVAIYPDTPKTGEQWVDGPQAFVQKQEQNKNKHLYNPKMDAEEQWVDGPREMMQDSDHKEGRKGSGHGRSDRKTHSREHSRDHSREHSLEPKGSSPSHGPKSGVKAKHPASCELKERPDSMASADSSASMTAQAADSRPTSMHSSSAIDTEQLKVDESGQPIKPFVRDWVEKHSALKAEGKMEDVSIGLIVNSDNQVIGNLETSNTGTYKRPKPEARKKIRSSTPKQSPHHSPRNSPAIGRKGTKPTTESTPKLQKSQLPGNANPTHRVTEWLRSVSMEQEMEVETQGHCANKKSSDRTLNTSMDVSSCSSLQDTTMESDLHNQSGCSADGQPDEMAECNIADISFDSSVDTTEFSNVILSNRESMYEIQMDEQLERSAEKSTSDVADDETFSSVSCNKDNELTEGEDEAMEDEPILLRADGMPHSSTIESIKTLLAEPAVSNEQLVCEKLCSFECPPSDLGDEDTPCGSMNQPLLRKPDGASNPNLINELNFERKMDGDFVRGDYIINTVHTISASQPRMDLDAKTMKNATSKYASLPKHSEALTKALEGLGKELCDSKRCTKSKPPLPSKPSSKSSVHSPSPSRQSPTKSGGLKEKDISTSPKSVSSTSSKNSSIPMGGTSRGRSDKEKSVRLQSVSSSSSQRSSSVPVTSSPSSTSTIRSTSSKSSKSQSPLSSRLPIFSSCKNTRKGNKDNHSSKLGNGRISELNRSSSRGTDSDSGNDSGIVTNEKKLLSPYSTVTKPRTPSHSSSGHGSDNSSTVSAELRSQLGCKSDKIHGGTSSGYESMLRDSEATASSSAHEDSNSESSNEKKKGSRRKRPSSRRSRSVPARTSESPENRKQSPSGTLKTSPSPKAWVDTRQIQKIKEEPFEIKRYDVVDVERLGRRRAEDEGKEMEQRKEKLKEILSRQGQLKPDSPDMKDQILMEQHGWKFDCKFLMCFSCRSKTKKTDV